MALEPCHPFAGQLSVADMKLRISQYVNCLIHIKCLDIGISIDSFIQKHLLYILNLLASFKKKNLSLQNNLLFFTLNDQDNIPF